MKVYGLLSVFLLPLAILWAGSLWWSSREDAARFQEMLAHRDSMIIVGKTARATLARETDDLRRALTREHADGLKRIGAKPVMLTRTVIEMRAETLSVALRDTILMRDGSEVAAWPFRVTEGRYGVSGIVYPEQRRIDLAIYQAPLQLDIVMAQTRAGNWLASVDTGDSTVQIRDIRAQVIPQRPGWWSRRKFWIGMIAGGLIVVGVTR